MRYGALENHAVHIGRAGWACVALMVGAVALRAQSAPPSKAPAPLAAYRHRVLGVYSSDTGTPLEGVSVTDILSGTKAVTTSTGTATLAFLPDGGSFVRIAKLGYETQTFLATISPKDTAPITIVLVHSAATMLPTVVTKDTAPRYLSPALQGFEERRKEGFGHFISEAELRKNDARAFSDLLERIPGLRMVTFKEGIYVASTRDQKDSREPAFTPPHAAKKSLANPDSVTAKGCWVTFYVDGSVLYDPSTAGSANPPDVRQLNINQFGGIEYYEGSATMPAQFNSTGNTCGTLLLWTRER